MTDSNTTTPTKILRTSLAGTIIAMMTISTPVYAKTGIASWYGGKFHGRTTASGVKFNKHALTAAHRKYTFGSKVKVTNQRNGRSVVVCINDRGPFAKKRIIDLSQAAASEIGMMARGTARVKLELISQPKSWRYGKKAC